MSFNKLTTFNIKNDDIEVITQDMVKTASFKIPSGFSYDADYTYLRVKAVSAGEYWGSNKNDDYFPETELINNYKSFLVAHTFKNHENKKIENAIGDVLEAEWSDRMKSVYLIIRIDKRIAPSVARGFEKGFMTDVSMGCRVDHVICSYCGQKAKTRFDYCEHLKTMKGKVMDNGKKVYEINIKPKFHDISAVLNGAERTAKVEGIYLNNSKVAFYSGNNELEKTASFESERYSDEFFKSSFEQNYQREDLNMEVIASSLKQDNKKETIDVSKSKKEINKKVENKACEEMCNANQKIFENIADSIKYKFSKLWDRNTCIEYGRSLKNLAKTSSVMPEQVFSTFLKILDASAIELSPLELHDIFFELFDFDSHDLRKIKTTSSPDDISLASNIASRIGLDNLGASIKVIKGVRSICESDGFNSIGNPGIPRLKAVIMKSGPVESGIDSSLIGEIIEKIVKPNLADRSNQREFLVPRLIKIANDDIKEVDNSSHFAPVKISMMEKCASQSIKASCDMATILYSAYQNDRVNSYNSGELESNMQKLAFTLDSDFGRGLEKTAAKKIIKGRTSTKAALYGFPTAIAYSGIQRARINNGEDVSSVNRFIGENPVSAALLSIAGIKQGANIINSNHTKVKGLVRDIGTNLKKAPEAIRNGIEKKSSFDIFNNENINVRMKQAGYKSDNLQRLKYATVLNKCGDESSAETLLQANNLGFSDIDKYLKVASECYKIELEKIASNMLKNIGRSVASDALLDNVKKGSGAAMIPGYIADGVIFAAIGKGLEKATGKKKGEGIKNV